MGKAIPPSVRKRIVELCQSGKTAKQVSDLLNIGYPGVAKIWRLYRKHGDSCLVLGYHRCGRKAVYGSAIRQKIDAILAFNEDLGAPIIRSRLLAQDQKEPIPHERTIQRWWKAQQKNKPRGRRPKTDRSYIKLPNNTWQVDAKEKVTIEDGSQHCYLSFTDEATCSFMKGYVFSL